MRSLLKNGILLIVIMTLLAACSVNKEKNSLNHSTAPDSTIANETQKLSNPDTGDSVNANSIDTGKEARYYPSSFENYKTGYNENFDFWFDMPEDWKAYDRSDSGDGYFIVTDNANMDIRVYGMYRTDTDEAFYGSLAGKKGIIEDFTFDDGAVGKKIMIAGSREYIVRVDGDTYICFYANFENNLAWFEQNTEKLNKMAGSLRTREEGAKLDSSTNKITLDDLKLGDISIDMPYKKVKEVLKKNLLKEETDGLGGKTLSYEDDTEIYIIDGTVYTMNVTNSGYPTPKGLKVGDAEAKVKELYGEPDNISEAEEGIHWGYTYNGYELFSLVLKDGVVTELQIDMVQ